MKIRSLIIAMLVGISFFPRGVVESNPSKEVIKITAKQQNSNTSSQISDSSEISTTNNNSSSFISSSEVISEEPKTTLTDEEIEEIVKKVSNAIIGEELTDKLFGVFGLGIIVIIGLYVVFQVYERKKNRDVGKQIVNDNNVSQKKLQDTQDRTMAMIKEYQTILDRVKFERDELEKLNTDLIVEDNERVKELTALTKQMHEDISKYTNAIAKYSQIEKKLDAILKIEKELANTPSNVKNGTTEKVNDIIKEVK